MEETKMQETKVCTICGQEKPVSEFWKNRYGYTNHCKECAKRKKVETINRVDEIESLKKQIEDIRKLRLKDYTPRELFVELKSRGFKWERMSIITEQFVDWNKI